MQNIKDVIIVHTDKTVWVVIEQNDKEEIKERINLEENVYDEKKD